MCPEFGLYLLHLLNRGRLVPPNWGLEGGGTFDLETLLSKHHYDKFWCIKWINQEIMFGTLSTHNLDPRHYLSYKALRIYFLVSSALFLVMFGVEIKRF